MSEDRKIATDAALKLANEHRLNVAHIPPKEPGKKVTVAEVQEAIKRLEEQGEGRNVPEKVQLKEVKKQGHVAHLVAYEPDKELIKSTAKEAVEAILLEVKAGKAWERIGQFMIDIAKGAYLESVRIWELPKEESPVNQIVSEIQKDVVENGGKNAIVPNRDQCRGYYASRLFADIIDETERQMRVARHQAENREELEEAWKLGRSGSWRSQKSKTRRGLRTGLEPGSTVKVEYAKAMPGKTRKEYYSDTKVLSSPEAMASVIKELEKTAEYRAKVGSGEWDRNGHPTQEVESEMKGEDTGESEDVVASLPKGLPPRFYSALRELAFNYAHFLGAKEAEDIWRAVKGLNDKLSPQRKATQPAKGKEQEQVKEEKKNVA